METKLAILIVDDQESMTETLSAILELKGFYVETANSGEAAITRCHIRHFDVILMDVRMPGLNGVEAFREIKTSAPRTRVIMMSAYSVEELKRQALAEEAIAFLQKPLDIEIVVKLIEQTEHASILMVMDDAEESKKLADALTQQQFFIYTCDGPEKALELAGQIHFSVLIIDTKLPNMTGLELYLAIKNITPTSVAIMLAETDEDFIEQAQEAVEQSAYTFLHKPLDMEALLEILDRIARQQHSDFIEKPGGAYE